MAADSTWTTRFAARTAGGQPWRSSEAFGEYIAGEVYQRNDDTWYPVLWKIWDGNLFCASNRGNNVAMIVAPTPAIAVTYPTRALDTDFVISTTQNAQVSYTVALTVSVNVLGLSSDDANIELQIDGVTVHPNQNAITAVLTLGVALTHPHKKTLSAFVPAGSTVRLSSSGTGTKTFVSAQEVLL